jgi:hypothetical protein
MLAYLDDILEPADAEELGKKIEESKFASDLVHRIRSSITRLRLPAPKLEGRGMGLDPNTVAEYLDNTLPADRVPDFEKVCLESDAHLAEVAACHQVLTLVLGEPADVPPHARERIYRLATLDVPAAAETADDVGAAAASVGAVEAKPSDSNGAGTDDVEAPPVHSPPVQDSHRLVEPPAEDEHGEKVTRAKPEVPDYLRATRRPRFWPAALALLLSFGLVVAALAVMGPLNQDHPLAKMFSRSANDDTVAANSDGDASSTPQDTDGESADGKADGSSTDGDSPEADGDDADGVSPAPPADGGPVGPVLPEDPVGLPGDDVIRPLTPGESTPTPGSPAEPPVPDGGETPAAPVDGGEPADGGATVKPPMPKPETPKESGTDTVTDVGPKEPVGPSEPVEPAKPVAEAAGLDVGRFISDNEVLIVEKPEEGMWVRVPTSATLASGQRLMALPTYRPQIALHPGVQVTLSGPSLVRLHAPLGEGVPMMQMDYGRAVMVTAGRADAKIGLQVPHRSGVLTFSSADSVVALEVSNYLPPGTNPEAVVDGSSPSMNITRMFVVSGRVEWEEAGSVVAINANQVRILADEDPGRTVTALAIPDWVSPSRHGDPDAYASRTVDPFLKTDTPVLRTLNELLEHRRVEVRSLAVRSLSYLGQYEQFVDELNDAFQKSYWDDAVDALRDAIARDPATAGRVRAALEKQRGSEANQLYRMLWGYSPAQLKAGGAEELVAALSHERMDFRVLAFENLKRITGKTLLYRPEFTERKNQPYVLRWREKLASGEIAYETPPTPLPELERGADARGGGEASTPRPLPKDLPASPLETPLDEEPEKAEEPDTPGVPF